MYRFAPTLLDSYERMKLSESETAQQEFLDRLNRVRIPPTDPMLRGIAFEAMVNDKGFERRPEVAVGTILVHDTEVSTGIILEMQKRLQGGIQQIVLDTVIATSRGEVFLHGVADYILRDTCIDVKTCGKYEFGKYLYSFQRLVYMEALRSKGVDVRRFKFLVTDFSEIYEEDYGYTEADRQRLVNGCEEFIDYIEGIRESITDKCIFGE